MIWMAPLPIWENHNSRTCAANYVSDLQAIRPIVFDSAVRNIECFTPADLHQPPGRIRLALAIGGTAARSHFATCKVQDPGTLTFLCHLEQRTATSLFHVIAMSGDGEDVEL